MALSASTRGQVWFADFVVGIVIFLTIVALFFVQLNSLQQPEENQLHRLLEDANSITNELLTQGYPSNWTQSTVLRPGITDHYRINQSKLNMLHQMDYRTLSGLLR